MLYFSVGSDKETRPRRRRTEGLVLTPITSRGKLRLAPGVLFPILRYLQGAINKLLPEAARGMKGTECRSRRKTPQMKSLLKVCGPAYSSATQGFRIIPGSTTRGPQALHTPLQHEKFTSSWMIRTERAITVYCRPSSTVGGVTLYLRKKKKNYWNASFARRGKARDISPILYAI